MTNLTDCRVAMLLGMTEPKGSTAFFAALAGVLFIVGRDATLQAAHLAFAGSEAHALGWYGTRCGFALGFGSELLGHE
jgi:hypothetical protein